MLNFRKRLKPVLQKTSLIIFGICAALFVAEAYLSIFNPQKTFQSTQVFKFNCFEESEHIWIRLKANSTCLLKSYYSSFPETEVKVNSLGLRNPEITIQKPLGLKRILFIGDSITMGWGVKEEEAFPRKTETILNKNLIIPQYQSINAGISATGPESYYLYLKNSGMDLNPDIVVIGFYLLNDINGGIDIDWTKTNAQGLPDVVRSKVAYVDHFGQLRFKNEPWKYKIDFLNNSNLFIYLADRFHPEDNQLTSNDPVLSPVLCIFKSFCKHLDKQKEDVKNLFLAMKDITDKEHKKLVIAMIPAEFQVYADNRQKYGIMVPLLPEDIRTPNNYFADFFKSKEIDYIDLLPVFEANRQPYRYFENDDHLNPDGQELTAEAISQKLEQVLQTSP